MFNSISSFLHSIKLLISIFTFKPPTEYHRRFAELNEKFIKKEWINAPVAYLDDLFAVLKNICSVYLIHAKECLMSLNALYSLPINDSPLSSFLTFSESLDRNPAVGSL